MMPCWPGAGRTPLLERYAMSGPELSPATSQGALGLGRDDAGPFPAICVSGLTVRCHGVWPDDSALLEGWARRAAWPFVHPIWQEAAWKPFAAKKRLRLLTIHNGENLLGVLPLRLSGGGSLYSIGADCADYLDPPVCRDAWPAVLRYIATLWDSGIKDLHLLNLHESAECRAFIPSIAESVGLVCDEYTEGCTTAIRLPATFDAFLSSLAAHESKEVRRKLRKAERDGAAELVRSVADERVATELDRCLDLMESSGGAKADAVRVTLRPLLQTAGPALIRQGILRLYTLHLQGRPACCLLQFATGSGPLLYNIGYDLAMRRWAPGAVAIAMSIRDAIAEGATVYDMLRGDERYKYRLGAVDRPLFQLLIRKMT